jgi:hypothetical protein
MGVLGVIGDTTSVARTGRHMAHQTAGSEGFGFGLALALAARTSNQTQWRTPLAEKPDASSTSPSGCCPCRQLFSGYRSPAEIIVALEWE